MPDTYEILPEGHREKMRNIARAIRNFAVENRLMRIGATMSGEFSPDAYGEAQRAFSGDAMSVLERQAIMAVGINAQKQSIFIYTHKRLTRAQQKL